MHRHDVGSQWISGPRRVTVWTPEAVEPGIPLLILHDGQNLFEPDRAHRPGHHWQVAEKASALIEAGRMPPIVIAGVDHGQDNRIVEMTPTEGEQAGSGSSWRYGRFIMEELVPYLQVKYGVAAGAGQLAMGGSSLGGLVTLAIAQQYPASFGRLLVMSPSLWWDAGVVLNRIRRRPLAPHTRVWLDVGLKEGRQTAANVRRLHHILADQLDAGNVVLRQDPEGDHTEESWGRRLPDALTWLFPRA